MSRPVILLGPLPPPYGGVSVYMSFLLEHLRLRGVGMWAYFGEPFEGEAGVRRFRHRRLGLVPLVFKQGRGARILDATHFHLEHPHPLLLPAWLLCKLVLRFRWYKNIHDGSLPARHRAFGPARRLLFRLAVREVDEFVVVSDELRRWLQDEVRVTQKVTMIPGLLPIPEATLQGGALPETTLEALAGYLRRPVRVCSVGVFISQYGFAHVAEALEALRAETGEDIGLVLLDGCFARDEAYRAGVLRGRKWITVLENVPNPEVYALLRRSHAFARGFGEESYGISRVEALWCGLPVVATNVGETRGMLTYEFGDVAGLTRQLRRALFEPPADEAREWAETFRREAEGNLQKLTRTLKLG